MGHFSNFSKSTKDVRKMGEKNEETRNHAKDIFDRNYNINLFRTTTQYVFTKNHIGDFKVHVVINNTLGTVIIDTGAKVSVCSLQQTKKWKLIEKMFPSKTKLKQFNSEPIKVEGQAICAVIFGSSSVPVKWHVVSTYCEPILAESFAISLGIITFNHKRGVLAPIKIINTDLNGEFQSCLAKYAHNFQGISKLKNH